MSIRVDIVTLFPELCASFLHASILGRAADKGLFEAHCHQIRDYTVNRQKQTDDYPYGGGCGMVLYAQPIADCLRAVAAQTAAQGRARPHIVFLTAAGKPYKEADARRLASCDSLVLVCGHYEGIDERVIEAFADEELSIGDYVLTGGELASLVVADSVLRLQPGVLAEEKGYQEESYWDGLLEYPQYTRPEVWEGGAVPPVLLCGDHDRVDAWRGRQSRARTRARRPDLYAAWCRSHPLTVLPRWRRNESAKLIRTDEALDAAAAIYAAGWRQVCAKVCTPEYVAAHDAAALRAELAECRAAGWAFYLHATGKTADGLVGVCHKTGEIGRLYVLPQAQGQGIGTKLLDFARKKLAAHAANGAGPQDGPWLRVLSTNAGAIGLYTRLGFCKTGVVRTFDPALDPHCAVRCQELEYRLAPSNIEQSLASK